MKELAICLVLTVILAGVNGQECTSAKLDECNVIYQKFVTAGVSDMAETCRIVTEFDVCIEPCKTLDANDPLYERYNSMYGTMSSLIPSCKCMGISVCIQPLSKTTPDKMCSTYEGVKKCLEPLMEKCKNEASYTSIQENLQNYEAQCASGCQVQELYKCFQSLDQVTKDLSNVLNYRDGMCMKMAEFKACTGTKLEMCRKVNNDPAKFAVKQGNMINNLMELLCMKEAKGLNESAECFNKKTVSDSMDKCINSSTPEQDDMGNFIQESEAQQCMRIQEHNICVETAVKSNCDRETASFAARLGESILKVIYDNKGLTCPTGGAGSLVPMTWMFAASLLALFLL